VYEPSARARLRLYCFPYAGGGASVFRGWSQGLPAEVEVCAVQLPGREDRIHEPGFSATSTLVDKLMEVVAPSLQPPFALFGHSMGAVIAFEFARRLRHERLTPPAHLFASGRVGPHIPDPDPPIHHLPDAEFIEELRRLGGTPEEVLSNDDLIQILMQGLRADFTLSERYTYSPGEPLGCPISACGGLLDRHVTREHLESWRQHTSASFAMRVFRGDHFYIHGERGPLLQWIHAALVPHLGAGRTGGGR
jgi:medium-chain acyl-[acyl-carrier-protein] hydrolase